MFIVYGGYKHKYFCVCVCKIIKVSYWTISSDYFWKQQIVGTIYSKI